MGKNKVLSEQVLVITGARDQIARSVALEAIRRGCRLVFAGADEEYLQRVSEDVRHLGGEAMFSITSGIDAESYIRVAQSSIRTFGTFDSWVHFPHPVDDHDLSRLDEHHMARIMDGSFWSTVNSCRSATAHFRRRGQRGVFILMQEQHSNHAPQSFARIADAAATAYIDSFRMELGTIPEIALSIINFGGGKAGAASTQDYATRIANLTLQCVEVPRTKVRLDEDRGLISVLKGISPLADKSAEREKKRSRSGKHARARGWVTAGRMYVEVSKRPVISSIMAAGLGAGMWLLTKRKTRTN